MNNIINQIKLKSEKNLITIYDKYQFTFLYYNNYRDCK